MSYHGRFVWYELMTTDTAGAKAFYPKVTGWTTQAWEGPMEYSMWINQGAPIGGVMTLPEEAAKMGAPPHWQGNIGTTDLDATVAKGKSLGAAILSGPHEIPTVGRFAVIADPQGAAFTAFQPAGEAPGHDGTPKVGEVCWHELYSSDAEAGLAFYSQLFGWEKASEMDMGPMGKYTLFGRGGAPIGGMMNRPPQVPVSVWQYYFEVENLQNAVDAATANGAKLLMGPMEVPGGGHIAMLSDPQGAAFALHKAP